MLRMVVLSLLFTRSAYALTPLKSLIFGDLTEEQKIYQGNPLNYVLLNEEQKRNTDALAKKNLSLYRGIFEEGENLENFCSKARQEIDYPTPWQKEQAIRATVATLQYIGLDISVKAIGQYAKWFKFEPQEYQHLVDRLIGNNCSKNLSLLSLKELRNNLELAFSDKNTFQLPTIKGNPFFPDKVLERYLGREERTKEQEFAYTVKLFRASCSWGGLVDNLRLLVPLLRHRSIMAYIFRQMTNQTIRQEAKTEKLFLGEEKSTVQVICENLICRRVDKEKFEARFPRGIGTGKIAEDLNRLYCTHFRDAHYKLKDQQPQVKEWILKSSLDDNYLVPAQFLALLTGIPDFLLRAKDFSQTPKIFRAGLDHTWNEWAKTANRGFAQDVFFEEPLSIERPSDFFDYRKRTQKNPLRVVFDVNLGEIDRVHEYVGKLSTYFTIPLTRSYLSWIQKEWKQTTRLDKRKREFIILRFMQHLSTHIEKAKNRFVVAPWDFGLERLVAEELLGQMQMVDGELFKRFDQEEIQVPVELRYGFFALKYLHDKQQKRPN